MVAFSSSTNEGRWPDSDGSMVSDTNLSRRCVEEFFGTIQIDLGGPARVEEKNTWLPQTE